MTTTMSSPYLPSELLDHVVDFLFDAEDALKSCCLTSKSWIPRTRKHLFAEVKFRYKEDLYSWKATFRDPSTSPACYTKTLAVECPWAATVSDAEEGGWIRTFSCVERLELESLRMVEYQSVELNCLLPFHGFSGPAIKSLRLAYIPLPLPLIFDFIYSFPLLEDLSVFASVVPPAHTNTLLERQRTTIHSLNPPVFTGSLELFRADSFITHLLSLTSGLHFRELKLIWDKEDGVSPTTSLVESCCSTLESLHVRFRADEESFSGSIDLSKATKLKDVTFVSQSSGVDWVTATLKTVTPNHKDLRKITIAARWMLYIRNLDHTDPTSFRRTTGETIDQEWSELDNLLTRLLESRPIRVEIQYGVPPTLDEEMARKLMESLLPEVILRGIVDMIGLGEIPFE